MRTKIIRIFNAFLKLLYLQLFMMLIAAPILLCWGLPISLLSPVGNLIFSPFLIGFLVLSTLIFISELCCIPNQWLIFMLEKLSTLWATVASYGTEQAFLVLPTPSLVLLFLIPVGTLIILHYKVATEKIALKIMALLLLCLLMVVCIRYTHTLTPASHTLDHSRNPRKLVCIDNQICLIDPGTRKKTADSQKWINYTLLPKLAQLYGTQKIDLFIALKTTASTLELADALCKRNIIKKIVMI